MELYHLRLSAIREYFSKQAIKDFLYYAIFFAISGIIHYWLCFYYAKPKPKKVAIPVAAIIKAPETKTAPAEKKPAPKKPAPKKPAPKKPAPKKPAPKKPEKIQKKEKQDKPIEYKENLELRKQLQQQMALLEKKRQQIEKLEKQMLEQQQQKLKDLETQKQQRWKKLEKQMLEQQQQHLQKLQTQKQQEIAKVKKELQQQLQQKLQKAERQYNQKQAQLQKREQQLKMELQKARQQQSELAQLSKDVRKIENKRRQELDELKKLREETQQRQQKMENTLLLRQQEMEKKLQRERATILQRQRKLEQQIMDYKKAIVRANKNSASKKHEREIINKQWNYLEKIRANSIGQHRKYIQKFATIDKPGKVVPALDLVDENFMRNLYDIMNFHKMEMIAYPQSQHYFISVDLNHSAGGGRYRKRTDFNHVMNLSSRGINAEAGFPHIVRDIQNTNLYTTADGHLNLKFMFPHRTANYFAWKSTTVCKKFGYDPKEVAICKASFHRKSNGFWSLIIEGLVLKSGRYIVVEDFEKNW